MRTGPWWWLEGLLQPETPERKAQREREERKWWRGFFAALILIGLFVIAGFIVCHLQIGWK